MVISYYSSPFTFLLLSRKINIKCNQLSVKSTQLFSPYLWTTCCIWCEKTLSKTMLNLKFIFYSQKHFFINWKFWKVWKPIKFAHRILEVKNKNASFDLFIDWSHKEIIRAKRSKLCGFPKFLSHLHSALNEASHYSSGVYFISLLLTCFSWLSFI